MADKIVAGGPPPADVADFAPGTLFWQMVQEEEDLTKRTFTLTTWSKLLPNQIDWGDGSFSNPVAWSVPPVGEGIGRADVTHAYTGRAGTIYRWFVEAGGVRDHGTVAAGEPAVVDDVSRDGISRPHYPDNQTEVFAERGKLATSVRKQMGAMPPRTGGMVN